MLFSSLQSSPAGLSLFDPPGDLVQWTGTTVKVEDDCWPVELYGLRPEER